MRVLPPSTPAYPALVAALLLVLALPQAANAAGTIYVDSASNADPATCGSVAEPCETLDDAVGRAVGGEQVIVAPGDYAGASISVPLHLRGAQVGTSGPARGIGTATRTTTIRGTLMVSAALHLDGFEFDGIATGAGIRFDPPIGGGLVGASVITNSTFTGIDGFAAIQADVELAGLTVRDNLFVAGAGATTRAVYAHGELVGGIPNVVVEHNVMRGYTGAAVDAAGTPGLAVRHNTVEDAGSLVVLSDASGAVDRIRVHDNTGTRFSAHALFVGRGVDGVTFEANQLTGGARSALRIDDWLGSGSTGDVVLRGNDVSGFATGISTAGAGFDGDLQAHGNRLVDVQRSGGPAVANDAPGTVDARRNWWGRSSGLAAGAVVGADASIPLRLVGVEAPAKVLTGGSGVVAVRLVGPVGGPADSDTSGFAVTFTTTSAGVERASVPVVLGRAQTMLNAGSTPGTTTTVATLDGESVRATTQVVGAGTAIDDTLATPSVAEARPAPTGRYTARARIIGKYLDRSLSRGFKQWVFTNRHASVRTTYSISHYDARRLGLRARTNRTRQPFIIARVRTRPIRGTRVVTARINARPRYALRRTNLRIAVQVQTVVRTRDGKQRTGFRRVVIPANAR